MELSKALDQISEIHEQMAKGEVYRGYRPLPVAICGAIGLLAGLAQEPILRALQSATPAPTPQLFIRYWVVVAVVAAFPVIAVILYRFIRHDDSFSRRSTQRVAGQFFPALASGVLIMAAFYRLPQQVVLLLPGLLTMIFGLGAFASRPYMPRAIGWVALFYVCSGAMLLANADAGFTSLGLYMGLVFGLGHFAMAVVLYFNIERRWL